MLGLHSLEPLLTEARSPEISGFIVDKRRELHKIPELMYEEHKTAKLLEESLKSMGIPVETGLAGGTGIIGIIGQGEPTVALRADIDALPVEEPEDLDSAGLFRSTHEGRMHACGHDGHMAMLLGAARMLQARAARLGGTVLLVFQPAEEGG
eukprot:CAMPEP_0118953450 /NCGR_PEP_ID=MMETSP1169-20130426/56582_1 /TAXON_ID=36882 /ORGANISM="Pyramimonas obovata, Strain CCMP722" /LENGTH=151 /DNA_ID=CAMNT_0006900905 /DNA_START=99 /DNA_END=551 /DNA_ORIENTATION=-